MAIYVCSDIHGHYQTFLKLVDKLITPDDKLYILGDVIDRGPEGIKILKYIMNSSNIFMIMGNHELFLEDYLRKILNSNIDFNTIELSTFDFIRLEGIWVNNGGYETFIELKCLTIDELRALYEYLLDIPYAVMEQVNGKNFYLTHSMPVFTYGGEMQTLKVTLRDIYKNNNFKRQAFDNAIWDRINDPDNLLGYADIPLNTILISGHTPVPLFMNRVYGKTTLEDIICVVNKNTCQRILEKDYFEFEPEILTNSIRIFHNKDNTYYNVDCGMAMAHEVSAIGVLRLDDMQEFYINFQ